jgi:16S rRNA A1518/A1519 N6-dimethyltransferase RsmA/KsgA/DIM1 with predicted DNA glycosylase/AP lyase activity
MTSMLEYFKMILKKVSFERSLFEKELNVQVSFPFTVTTDIVQKLLKQENSGPMNMMYM